MSPSEIWDELEISKQGAMDLDGPSLLDIRPQGYGDDDDWDGLTDKDVLEVEDTGTPGREHL